MATISSNEEVEDGQDRMVALKHLELQQGIPKSCFDFHWHLHTSAQIYK